MKRKFKHTLFFLTSLSGQSYQVKSKRSIPLALLHDDDDFFVVSERCTTKQTFANLFVLLA